MNVKGSLTWLAYWLRFHLWQRRRFNKLVLEHVAGRPFLILPQVFNPTLFLTSKFMVSAFNEQLVPLGSRMLDMGTGSGIGAIFAAQRASQVVAVDVNPAAVRCAHINVLLNQAEDRVQVIESDLFAALPLQTFDVILFNPPFLIGEPTTLLDKAFWATDVIERFALTAADYLAINGRILLLLSSLANEPEILAHFPHFQIAIAARQNLNSEVVTLYQLSRKQTKRLSLGNSTDLTL